MGDFLKANDIRVGLLQDGVQCFKTCFFKIGIKPNIIGLWNSARERERRTRNINKNTENWLRNAPELSILHTFHPNFLIEILLFSTKKIAICGHSTMARALLLMFHSFPTYLFWRCIFWLSSQSFLVNPGIE